MLTKNIYTKAKINNYNIFNLDNVCFNFNKKKNHGGRENF